MNEILEEFLRYSLIYKLKVNFLLNIITRGLNTLMKMKEKVDYY
jgi:hypothetical protein